MASQTINRLYSISSKSREDPSAQTKLYNEFDVGEALGRGGFGQIVQAKRRSDDNEFAIKIIEFDNTEDAGKYIREAEFLSKLNHPNIVRYYNSWTETALVPHMLYKEIKGRNRSKGVHSLISEIQEIVQKGYKIDKTQEKDYLEQETRKTKLEAENCDDESERDSEDSFVTFDRSQTLISNEVENEPEDHYDSECDSDVEDEDEERQEKTLLIKYLFIQMELCAKRTLRSAIDEGLYQREPLLTKYFREICEGLSYIHKEHIAHRDLKPENIFLTHADTIKIGDFGLSKRLIHVNESEIFKGESSEKLKLHDNLPYGSLTAACGTPCYVAPELYDAKIFDTKVDIYSLGIIYFEMCSKPPATESEKVEMLSNILQRLKTSEFSKEKIWLIRNMIQINYNKRITCTEILKILNREKTVDEVKQMMQEHRKIPIHQTRAFVKKLKSKNFKTIDATNFFIKNAAHIFELHGARNIDLPTFLPPFNHCNDNLIKFLSANGNYVSLSNTSRIAFSYYVAKNNIKHLRRYAVGKSFDEGDSLPNESYECVFETVSAKSDDFVNDAETLYVVSEVLNKVLTKKINKNVTIFINHTNIFSELSKRFNFKKEFVGHLLNFFRENVKYRDAKLPDNVKMLFSLWIDPWKLTDAETLFSSLNMQSPSILKSCEELKTIAINVEKFGIKPSNIRLEPFYFSEDYYSGMIFKVEHKSEGILAVGGRFDSLIKNCSDSDGRLSAAGVTFNIDNFVRLLNHLKNVLPPILNVYILAEEKDKAIPVFKELLSRGVKCQIVDHTLCYGDLMNNRCNRIIILKENDDVTVQHSYYNGRSKLIYEGSWKSPAFFSIVTKK